MSIEQQAPLAPFVLPLNNDGVTIEQVGGKGASLARMAVAGLPVPPGFYITTAAYRRFVDANGIQAAILEAVAQIDASNPSTLEATSSSITKLFLQGTMPDDIAQAIREAYARLGGGELAVAVRSSATAEDLPEMSFAGQQETYLNMRGEAMVLDAVKRCWASLWTARAIGYRARQHIAPEDVSLAVVVQELVPADAAGILFTAHPITGRRDQVMINAAWGLGEAIVGGLLTPDTFVVEKASGKIVSQEVADKTVMTVRDENGTHEEPVPDHRRNVPSLTAEQAAALAQLGVQIERLYGQPMDIEWALHDGEFFVVQARPITALPEVAAEQKGEQEIAEAWQLPHPKGSYVRGSVIELMPDPLTPLFATLGLPAWNRALGQIAVDLRVAGALSYDMLLTINDYAYYDMTPFRTQPAKVFLLIPAVFFLPPLLRTARQRWEQEGRPTYIEVTRRWEHTDLHTSTATSLLDGAREIVTAAANYYLTIQTGILPAAYMSETLFTLFYEKLIKRRDDPPALTFLLGYDSAPIEAEKSLYDLAQWVRAQQGLAENVRNMSRDQFAEAYQSGHAVGVDDAVWQEFRQRLAEHLATFGHTIYDLDFAKPVLADDPAALLETLKYFLSDEASSPYARQQASAQARTQAMHSILSRVHGPQLSLFRRVLRWAQRMAPLREDALDDVGLGWPVLRRMLHELGRRFMEVGAIAGSDDVFWLTADELQSAVQALDQGKAVTDYRDVVAQRHARWENERRLTPPAALPVKGGARLLGIDYSAVLPARVDQNADAVIRGIGASPGRVTGTARVIHGPDEFGQMQPGDILVARITTPAWTPLFALAAGVVTDVGGPLSHSSIVAREYRIPAVLGTGAATERLHSGQRVIVDGDAGQVTIDEARHI